MPETRLFRASQHLLHFTEFIFKFIPVCASGEREGSCFSEQSWPVQSWLAQLTEKHSSSKQKYNNTSSHKVRLQIHRNFPCQRLRWWIYGFIYFYWPSDYDFWGKCRFHVHVYLHCIHCYVFALVIIFFMRQRQLFQTDWICLSGPH